MVAFRGSSGLALVALVVSLVTWNPLQAQPQPPGPTPLPLQPIPPPAVPVMPRLNITIDPETPFAELLPRAPKTGEEMLARYAEDLTKVPEVHFQDPVSGNLTSEKATYEIAHQLAKMRHLNKKKTDGFVEALLASRADLHGLPFAMGESCRMAGPRAKLFGHMAQLVHQCIAQASAGKDQGFHVNPETFWTTFTQACQNRDEILIKKEGFTEQDLDGARVAALVQILSPQSNALRLGLVKWLSKTAHVEATQALAKLALFSPEEEVRKRSIEALKLRRDKDYTAILIHGFCYPLPAVAKRAAEAVIALERADLVPQLVGLLDEEDPRLPVVRAVKTRKITLVRELVRVNHHRNCAFCHAPANEDSTGDDLSTAPVPLPNEPLPSPTVGGYGSKRSPDILVRVDVTYLRQDFSLLQRVHDAHPWPEMQRFDFLVRTRVLTDKEAQDYAQQAPKSEASVQTPYRRAVLFALRELTGRDTAPTAEAWRDLLGMSKAN